MLAIIAIIKNVKRFSLELAKMSCYASIMILTAAQCRAARALLDWTQIQLAERSRVGNATIRNFESGNAAPQISTLAALQRALEEGGVKFTNGGEPGVKLTTFRCSRCGFEIKKQNAVGNPDQSATVSVFDDQEWKRQCTELKNPRVRDSGDCPFLRGVR